MKFRKKPIEVEAVQLTQEWIDQQWRESCFARQRNHLLTVEFGDKSVQLATFPDRMIIETLEGSMTADIGDWIITGVEGEIYPCKKEIFEKTYDKVK